MAGGTVMESTQRKCPEKGCERHPSPGWTRCEQHSEEWLTRVFAVAVPDREPSRRAYYSPTISESENRVLDGNR